VVQKGDSHLLCEAPFGPFRQKVAVTFLNHAASGTRKSDVTSSGGERCADLAPFGQFRLLSVEQDNGSRHDWDAFRHASTSANRRICSQPRDLNLRQMFHHRTALPPQIRRFHDYHPQDKQRVAYVTLP
jgi:hypothetical protein